MIISNDRQDENLKLDEKSMVEEPFLEQLEVQGWEIVRLRQVQDPQASYRSDFNQVVLVPKLEEAIRRINTFLEDDQVSEIVRTITSSPYSNLIENNQYIFSLLHDNTSVSTNRLTGENSPTVRFIDYENLANNSFVAISQFKIRIPGTEHHFLPDITLFVNGLPLVVVECKSLKAKEPIADAIDQLMRYSEQRGAEGEGNQELFFYNQIMVSTCRTQAKFGTISTRVEKLWFRWTDPYPLTLNDLPSEGTTPNDQQRLIAGMLSKQNLLDLIQSFTIFSPDSKGHTIKIVGRYQQFRAVKKTIKKLREGTNREERSGIIWHTQGSGKSLTMMFMVREMRRLLEFNDWKIVFITDRTQLEDQLAETGQSVGQTIKMAEWINRNPVSPGQSLKELLSTDTPDLVMAMIQKFQERDLIEIFPVLNESSKILVLIDEAHRAQYKLLGANIDRALPNATRIAYTGTPIDKTEKTFGDYIDKYTMRQSIEDGTTLGIIYEGRTNNAEVEDKPGMDATFEDVFSDYNLMERLQILGFGTRDAYLEAKDVIREKAKDMVGHFIEHVFPGGFKAQVVATSREAACRYKDELEKALIEKINELERRNPHCINVDQLKTVEIAVVISGSHNDLPHLKQYSSESYHKDAIRRFKLPFDSQEQDGDQIFDGHVGIIVVNNMLLTGFDAPLEQVMYLDRVITDHNLLQAIARVNRVCEGHKDKGFIVDYVGVGHHLKRALDSYADREQEEILQTLGEVQEELNNLVQAHREIIELLHRYNLSNFNDPDAYFDLFYDEDIRFEYILAFNKLTLAMNSVMPRREALDYWEDYQNLLGINELASRHLMDSRLSMKGIPEKLRGIADAFLTSQGITLKIEPISILSPDFEKNVKLHPRSKTKAAEVEHALRHYIDLNVDDDPELFVSFAEALEKILKDFAENWDKIYEELERLRVRIKNSEQENTYGLDRKKQMPIFRILRAEVFNNDELDEDKIAQNVDLTQHLFILVEREIRFTGFWQSIPAQNRLKAELQELLLSERFCTYPNVMQKYREIISRLMEWARANNGVITRD